MMSSTSRVGQRGVMVTVLACGFAAALNAQTPVARPGAMVEMDPIRCWWKTDKDAVLVSEQFTLTLTCSLLETTRTKTAADGYWSL